MSLFKKPLNYVGALSVILVSLLGVFYFSSQHKGPDPVMVELGTAVKKKPPQGSATPFGKKAALKEESSDIVSRSDRGEKTDTLKISESKEKTSPRERSQKDIIGVSPHPVAPAAPPQQADVAAPEPIPPQAGVSSPAPQGHAALQPRQITPEATPGQAPTLVPNAPHEAPGVGGEVSSDKSAHARTSDAHKGEVPKESALKKPSGEGTPQDEPYVVSLDKLNKPTGLTSYEEAALQRPGKIVLMLIGLGRQEELSHDAVALPKEVALAFHEGSDTIEAQKQAHDAGHETFVMVPMEPIDYPKSDPGPMPLFTGIPAAENIQRLESHLDGRMPCTGVVPFLGSRFMFSEKDLSPILTYLHKKGLLFVDTLSTHQSVLEELSEKLKIPNIAAHICLGDREMDKEAIDERLVVLEKNARIQGHIIVFAWVRPAMLFCLEEWVPTLAKKNIQLIPYSALTLKEKKTP